MPANRDITPEVGIAGNRQVIQRSGAGHIQVAEVSAPGLQGSPGCIGGSRADSR
jgi:hypothetical protein